jgi:hypothetical protein
MVTKLLSVKRGGQHTAITPSLLVARHERLHWFLELLRPFPKRLGIAVHNKVNGDVAIVDLVGGGGPLYVAGFVMAIIVDPIQRVAGSRLSTQDRKKLFKRVESKFNSPTAVDWIFFMVAVLAPSLRGIVRLVFTRRSRPRFALAFAMTNLRLRKHLNPLASARTSVAGAQVNGRDSFHLSANATAVPRNAFWPHPISRLVQHCQEAKGLTGQVEFVHGSILT